MNEYQVVADMLRPSISERIREASIAGFGKSVGTGSLEGWRYRLDFDFGIGTPTEDILKSVGKYIEDDLSYFVVDSDTNNKYQPLAWYFDGVKVRGHLPTSVEVGRMVLELIEKPELGNLEVRAYIILNLEW